MAYFVSEFHEIESDDDDDDDVFRSMVKVILISRLLLDIKKKKKYCSRSVGSIKQPYIIINNEHYYCIGYCAHILLRSSFSLYIYTIFNSVEKLRRACQ